MPLFINVDRANKMFEYVKALAMQVSNLGSIPSPIAEVPINSIFTQNVL